MNEMNGRFWMVWCPTGHAPTYKHPSFEMAKAEADRLARMHPGSAFWVLESLGHSQVTDPCQRIPAEQGLPF